MTNITRPSADDFRFTLFDALLYAAIVFAWSTSWYPLKLQIGAIAPEVSLVWRFVLAGSAMFLFLLAKGHKIRFQLKDHARFALMGTLIFSTNFLLFYYASEGVASGLLSVIFSTASIISLVLATLLFNERLEMRVVFGAALGICGIALLFLPEITGTTLTGTVLRSILLGLCGTCCFCLGSLLSASNQRRGLPLVSTTAWGMFYGTLWLGAIALIRGQTFAIEWTPSYIGSLLWLVGSSTLLAFAAYLTLVGRIGAARAGYATVLFPIFALMISTLIEGYQWSLFSLIGFLLVIGGNYYVLSRKHATSIGSSRP